MAYPQSNLVNDTQDAPYGGAPANRWGTPARQFLDSCIQAIQKIILTHVRVPYGVHVVTSTTGNSAGDVCWFDAGQFVPNQGYAVRNTSATNAIMWGVFLDAAGVGGKTRVCWGGVISASLVGLPLQTAGTPVAVNNATGKLKVAAVGDSVVGYFDVNGNVFLLAPGRLV
jgi:hypothetical protein